MKKLLFVSMVLSLLTVGAARAASTITISGTSVTVSGTQVGTYVSPPASNQPCVLGYKTYGGSDYYAFSCGATLPSVCANMFSGVGASVTGAQASTGDWLRANGSTTGSVAFCTSNGWILWSQASSYSSGSTHYDKAIECTSVNSCIARTEPLCSAGYFGGVYWQTGSLSCSACPSSGWSNNPATSVPGSNTANTGCYVKPNISNTDEKGTWHYTENCYYSS